jgi:hypothetical protein
VISSLTGRWGPLNLEGTAAQRFDNLATPHPLAAWEEKQNITGKRDKVKSKWYIVAKNSGIPIFTEMAKQLKPKSEWVIEELPCSHMVAIEIPQETVDILLRGGSA